MVTPRLEIDLSALLKNIHYYLSLVNSGTKVMVMTKANAYGFGASKIVNFLKENDILDFGVANPMEAVCLRKECGKDISIMVLNPLFQDFSAEMYVENALEPVIYDIDDFRFLENISSTQKLCVHLKWNTGMNRYGMEIKDVPFVTEFLKKHPCIKVKSVMSHLASSEDSCDDNFTKEQIKKFQFFYKKISKKVSYPILKHIANSAAVSRFSEARGDLIRLGIGVYGSTYNTVDKKHIYPVAKFVGSVTQIRNVSKHDFVGYNRKGNLKNGGTIATVNVGYGDGFFRSLGNGKHYVFVDGHLVPTVGNVSMDSFAIDVSGIPVKRFDEVELFGNNVPIKKMAQTAGTISYEVFTRITSRVKREYFF